MEPAETSSKPRLPAWITDHFEESIDSHERLLQIIHISARGISVLRGIPQVIQVLAKVREEDDQSTSLERIERAKKEAALAEDEIDKDFPVLNSFAIVAIWSWLEHFVKGFLALWLINHDNALSVDAVQKLRIRLGEYLSLEEDEQAHFLVESLEQDLTSSLKRGANRFESLLEPFGLSGPLPDECGKTLFELQQVRNSIAHRNGRADRAFLSACPWIETQLNAKINVSTKMLHKYANASADYLLTILYRVGDIYDINLRDPEESEIVSSKLPPAASGT